MILVDFWSTGSNSRKARTAVAPDGSSRITVEDFAVALLDEIERPGTGRHFTVVESPALKAGSGYANHR